MVHGDENTLTSILTAAYRATPIVVFVDSGGAAKALFDFCSSGLSAGKAGLGEAVCVMGPVAIDWMQVMPHSHTLGFASRSGNHSETNARRPAVLTIVCSSPGS